jgi:hypothetical protein
MELSCKAWGRHGCTTKQVKQFTMKANSEEEAEYLAEFFRAIRSGRYTIARDEPTETRGPRAPLAAGSDTSSAGPEPPA